MGTLSEEAYERLILHMDAFLRDRVGLTAEFEGELAMDAISRCTMAKEATQGPRWTGLSTPRSKLRDLPKTKNPS